MSVCLRHTHGSVEPFLKRHIFPFPLHLGDGLIIEGKWEKKLDRMDGWSVFELTDLARRLPFRNGLVYSATRSSREGGE